MTTKDSDGWKGGGGGHTGAYIILYARIWSPKIARFLFFCHGHFNIFKVFLFDEICKKKKHNIKKKKKKNFAGLAYI